MSGRLHLTRRDRMDELRRLDGLSRSRALTDAESRRLERLLHAEYCARLRCDQPIPRRIA